MSPGIARSWKPIANGTPIEAISPSAATVGMSRPLGGSHAFRHRTIESAPSAIAAPSTTAQNGQKHAHPCLDPEEEERDEPARRCERGLRDPRSAAGNERREADAEHADETDGRKRDAERASEDRRLHPAASAARLAEHRRGPHVVDEKDRARDERSCGENDREPEPDVFPHAGSPKSSNESETSSQV